MPDLEQRQLDISAPLPREHLELFVRCTITVGETAYNIRSALDYLIYSIARGSNSGKEVEGTQFPMEESEKRYRARATGVDEAGKPVAQFLVKVPQDVVDELAQYQPYAGCKWVRLLRQISNLDKHRHLTTLTTSTKLIPEEVRTHVDSEARKQVIDLKSVLRIDVTLPGGEDLTDALELIHREARTLVHSYAGRFDVDPTRPARFV